MIAQERPAVPGERCTCGRAARIVFATEAFGEVGWCGVSDGGRGGVCVFCGSPTGHDGARCPAYRLQIEDHAQLIPTTSGNPHEETVELRSPEL